jgi:radical SAM protein with 4Fe4S-binding SPASM domain
MGQMSLDLFKRVIDQAEGNIEFISLASRGEPLACPDIVEMFKYTTGKFLNLKLNTNASLLDEKKCHAILSGGVKTVVFSADAATEPLYSKLRVNGSLSKVLKNIENFKKIKETKYSNNPIISRVSGVKFNNEQNLNSMEKVWGSLVDQVAFVNYNPWENSYDKEPNNIIEPCSDLWRRMFVWWDGKVNPCDVDYKSELSSGNILKDNISNLWGSNYYNELRANHMSKLRKKISPCNRCVVI